MPQNCIVEQTGLLEGKLLNYQSGIQRLKDDTNHSTLKDVEKIRPEQRYSSSAAVQNHHSKFWQVHSTPATSPTP
ncbi:hypothetical protein GN956_G4108 [Arapaima gigas]